MQNDSIDNIRIDLNREKVKAAIYVRQGDTLARTIHCTLASGGTVVSLVDAIVAEIMIDKADGTECDNGVVIVGDELQYTLRTNDIPVGENLAQFRVTYGDGTVVTSPQFSIFSYQKSVSDKTVQSKNEYSSLTEQVVMAKQYASSASSSSAIASTSESTISEYMEELATIQTEISESEANAKASEESASASSLSAIESASTATEAATTATTASESATTASESASASATEAAESAEGIDEKLVEAKESASTATASATTATEYASIATSNGNLSKSYAVGGTGTRQSEDIDNSAYYYEQAKQISQSFSGAMLFKQTLEFANIPSLDTVTVGWQYNITDEFTTDDRFIEGAGILKGMGTDILCITDDDGNKKWNCLSDVTVHGVKGSAEATYRQGNVEITADNLGLAAVATSGSYADLSDKPSGASFGECSDSPALADKTVAIDGFQLEKGAIVVVRFTGTSGTPTTSGTLSLNVSGTGAKEMMYNGATLALKSYYWWFRNNRTYEFIYDGTNWNAINVDTDTTYNGSTLKTSVAKTGTAQDDITSTIAAWTTVDNVVGTLLNNDATLAGGALIKVTKEDWDENEETYRATGKQYLVETDGDLFDASDVAFDDTTAQLGETTVQGAVEAINSTLASLFPTKKTYEDLTNSTTWTPSRTGFYNIRLTPTGTTQTYAVFTGSTGNARVNSFGGYESYGTFFFVKDVTYTIAKGTLSGLIALS